jgi:hypothetical protein
VDLVLPAAASVDGAIDFILERMREHAHGLDPQVERLDDEGT